MKYKTIKIPKGVRHSLWSVMDAALYPAVSLATVPVMIHALGLTAFGAWLLINSIITISQLFNFNSGVANMGMAIIRNISAAVADKDTRHANDVINSTLHITFILFISVSVIGSALGFAVVRYKWWGLGDLPGLNITLCILLAVVIAGLKYFDQVFQSVIKAYERFRMSSILNMIYRFGSLGVAVVMAVAHYSIVWILWANIIFLLAYLLLEYCCVKWLMPEWKIEKVSDREQYKKLLQFSIWPWIQVVIIVFTFQTDRFWVSSHFGLKEVSGYGLASTIFNQVHMIFTAMALWILPRIASMASRGEDPAKLYYKVRGAIMGFIVISLLVFYYIAPPLMLLWVGKETAALLLNYIKYFIAFEMVFAHSIMPFFYLNAAGKDKLATRLTLFYCGVCYTFMLGGLWLFQTPLAMIAGMAVAMCITMPVVNAVVQREMYQAYNWKQALFEMLPMYAAILLLFSGSNIWMYTVLAFITGALLWKFYLSNLFNNSKWQQRPYM